MTSSAKDKNWLASLRRVWNYHVFGEDPTVVYKIPVCVNAGTFPGDYLTGVNAANTNVVDMMGVDINNAVVFPSGIGGQMLNPPMLKDVTFDLANNASIGTQTFFIADRAYQVMGITYAQKTQGTVAGAVCSVTHETGTQAPGTGSALQTGTFDCHGTVNNTVVTGTLAATPPSLTLAVGDRLSVLFAGTLTTLAGVTITVTLSPSGVSETAQYYININGDIATQTFFVANRDMTITMASAIFATAFATNATLQITKDTGTTAPGAGTSILAAAIPIDGTGVAINTVTSPALTATAATLSMAAGDRLAVKYSATTTGTGVCVTIAFKPEFNRSEITWQLGPNLQQQVAQNFFIADRAYTVLDASCTFATAAGGAAKLGVTIDKGTTAPGGGNVIQTDNASAGFDVNATANTVQFMTPATLHLRLMSPGDRLGLVVTGAHQSLADVAITVSLAPLY